MMMLLAFILALAILVVIHEFGHYQVAKWCGVKVLRFSVGFGRALYSRRYGKDQTEFVIASIPMGGYVKMLDERELTEDEREQYQADLPRAFNRQSVYKRMAIVIAGPLANLILAVLLYWLLTMQGVTGIIPKLAQPHPNSAAQIAGFAAGQQVIAVAGKPVQTWQEMQWQLLQHLPTQHLIPFQVKQADGQVRELSLNAAALSPEQLDENLLDHLGFVLFQPDIPAVVGVVQENSPAARSGIQEGDRVLAVNQTSVRTWAELVELIRPLAGQQVQLLVLRAGKQQRLNATLDDALERGIRVGKLGIGPKLQEDSLRAMTLTQYYSVPQSLQLAIQKTWQTSVFSLKMLIKMISGQASIKTISGPVTIANYAGQSAHMGLRPYLAFLAILSISLGVLNLLPIPILDGGHLMYYTAEVIWGRPMPESWMMIGQKLGFVLLGALMLLALFNDLSRLLTGSF